MNAATRDARLSLLKKLGLLFLFALLLLAAVIFYIQTRHGFRHVLIPLAAKLTGARLEVQDGYLSLFGMLEANGFVYDDSVSGISVQAERVALRVAPWSFFTQGVPRIDDLEVKRANLSILLRPEAGVGPVPEHVLRPGTFPQMPVVIERARLEDLSFTLDHDDRRITGRATALLDQLGPGRSGTITLRTESTLERDGTPNLSGLMELTLSVDVESGGTPVKWSGSSRARVRTGQGSFESGDPDVFTVEQTLTGEHDSSTQRLGAASTIAIYNAGVYLGTADITAAMDGTQRPAVTDVALRIRQVQRDTLNVWLNRTSTVRIQAGAFDARLEARIEGTRTSVRGHATGSGVSLRLSDGETSPPVDVSLQHGGSFDSVTSDVVLEQLSLSIGEKAKTLLSGSLDHPFVLHLNRFETMTSSAVAAIVPARWSLRLAPCEIQKVRPWLALSGRDLLKGFAAARLGGALTVTVHEREMTIDVAGRFDGTGVMVRNEEGGRDSLTGPFSMAAEWRSRLKNLRVLELDSLTATINLKGKQVATLRATGAWIVVDTRRLTALHGALKLTGLRGETLNPLLGLWSEARIGRAILDGHAEMTVDESRATWDIDIGGRDVQLRLPDTTSDAPPLTLQIKQTGEFDRIVGTLRLNQLGVHVVERRRPVLLVSLDHPLMLNLGQGIVSDGSKTGRSSEPITLAVRIDRLGVHLIRPWIALSGNHVLAEIQRGDLDADLKVRFMGTDDVTVAGRVDLDRIIFEHNRNSADASLRLGTEVRASVIGRSQVEFESWELRALNGNTVLAQARLTGSAGAAGPTRLEMDLTVGNVSEFIRRLGIFTVRQREMIAGGNLTGNVRLATPGPGKPVTVTTGLKSTNLSIRMDTSHQLTQTVLLQAEVEVDASRTVAEFQRVHIATESGGTGTGTLTVSGRWPLTTADTNASAVSLNVTAYEWDSGPSVDFFGLLPGRRSGSLPVTGELKLTREAGSQTVALQGKETMGSISIVGKGGAPEPATIHLEHAVTWNGNELRVAMLSLTSERPNGRADRVAMTGNIRMRPSPGVQLRGNLGAVDADWYAALMSAPPDQGRAGKPHDATDEGSGVPALLDLDVDFAIGSVFYRTLEFGKGRLLAKGDGTSLQATLEPTGLAGGSVDATLTVTLENGEPQFVWDAKGNSLDIGLLSKRLLGESEPRVTGLGRFTTSGTGRGRGEAVQQSLTGTAVFDMADGQFVKSRVMEFLAEQTRIEQFRGLAFRTLHGDLQLKDGWVHLKQLRAEGPGVILEADGKIGLDGRLDAHVQPKIGPDFSDRVRIPCLDQFAKTADGFTVLPVAVSVKGTATDPALSAQTTAGSIAGRHAGALVGTIADLLTVCQGGDAAQKASKGAVETAKDFFQSLLGGKKDQRTADRPDTKQ